MNEKASDYEINLRLIFLEKEVDDKFVNVYVGEGVPKINK